MLCNRWGKGGKWWKGISGQKGYGKADTVPVMEGEKENLERTKSGIHRFITNFLVGSIKKKNRNTFIYL